jgi:hypothetical protein
VPWGWYRSVGADSCHLLSRADVHTAGSDPDPTVFFAQLWSVLTHPLPARPTERELHAALNGIETTPHPHTMTRRHRTITVDHPQRSSLPLGRMHLPTPFLPLRPRSSTRLQNCYGNVVWRARRMRSLYVCSLQHVLVAAATQRPLAFLDEVSG